MKVDNNTFRSGYLQVLESKIIKALPGTDLRSTPHIESKIKKWKKVYNSLFSLLSLSGIGWNDTDKMLDIVKEEAWDDNVKDVDAKSLRNKSWPFYEDWLIIFGKNRANGEFAESATDAVQNMDKEDKVGEFVPLDSSGVGGMECSNSVTHRPTKADSRMKFIGSRMGYANDLSATRKGLNAKLLKLPLCPNDRLSATDLIIHDAQRIDFFFSLSNEDKLLYVNRLLS
ncbi:hypothetical protein Acr_01g0005520 [Actinidia rufa]|uniref:Myb/SANT-like domain-containing protein n=1 Tax=Actinidia rufa TaxID=165716 RepID=A0A7J0E2J0_9ERIC|nr:hypothetical protein Acr_01g0005520 [Actinidia rufa]